MKAAFATCVELGKSCIEEIYRIDGKLDLLITLNDDKASNKSGRIYLDEFANKKRIPLLKINNINDKEVIEKLKTMEIDWLFIIGWSQIAKKELLDTPSKGCIGMHPTLLPEGRGRAAIPWAILKGLDKTGVTAFKIDEGVDTGPIIDQVEISLPKDETASSLYHKVNDAHILLIEKIWKSLETEGLSLTVQDNSKATYWGGRKPQDGEISAEMTINEADALVRAVTKPYPGSFYQDGNVNFRIWDAEFSTEEPGAGIYMTLKDGYLIPIKFEKEVLENA